MIEPEQKATLLTKTCAHTQKIMLCIWSNSKGMLYYELLHRCVTTSADIYCQQLRRLADAIQEKYQQVCVKWCYSTITPARTLLTWQKNTIQELVGKSFRTHLTHLILRPQIFTFPLSIEQPSRNFLSGWKCSPDMAWRLLQFKTTRFLQTWNRKITPSLADCCK